MRGPTLRAVAWAIWMPFPDLLCRLALHVVVLDDQAFPHTPMLPYQPQQHQFATQSYQAIHKLLYYFQTATHGESLNSA